MGRVRIYKLIFACLGLSLLASPCMAQELWKITFYDACTKCCGKTDGITASGKKVRVNRTVACNWLPFGTRLLIDGRTYVVEDRGARSHFGDVYSKRNPNPKKRIKHIDIYVSSHKEARKLGVRYLPVEILASARSQTIATSERPLARGSFSHNQGGLNA